MVHGPTDTPRRISHTLDFARAPSRRFRNEAEASTVRFAGLHEPRRIGNHPAFLSACQLCRNGCSSRRCHIRSKPRSLSQHVAAVIVVRHVLDAYRFSEQRLNVYYEGLLGECFPQAVICMHRRRDMYFSETLPRITSLLLERHTDPKVNPVQPVCVISASRSLIEPHARLVCFAFAI
ncbi:hypothetical protein FKP32DRAFT_155495 [Trametes sanguinea]|nr:hypothetical protein FKP32DRAFT_155495 [Trametes sanguinea]